MKILSQLSLCLLAAVGASPGGTPGANDVPDAYASERRRMLDEITLLTRESRLETGRVMLSDGVRTAMAKVPRHEFVPPNEKRHAYENRPLPIGHGQTISQPFIVALMTDIMAIRPGDKVLEIGTGSGYQAAVLAELASAVYTVE